jgi:hypothetical protein
MKISTIPTSKTPRSTCDSSCSAFAAHTYADHAHQTRASTSIPRPKPGHDKSRERSVVTWVKANTNTRSHNSSTGVVRRSSTPRLSLRPAVSSAQGTGLRRA